MRDLANVVNGIRIRSAYSSSDHLFLEIPEVNCVRVCSHPLLEQVEVVDFVTARFWVVVGLVHTQHLLSAKIIGSLPKGHTYIVDDASDSAFPFAVRQGENGDIF